MTDQELALQGVSDTQRVLQDYLQPRPQHNGRHIPGRLVEVLDRPDLIVAAGHGSNEVMFELLQ